jgi:hypothetical protein
MAKEQRRVTMEPLDRGRRGLSAFIGVAGLWAGTVAVFESSNQAGTVALLTIGALASVFALLGKVPLRWVVAGTELDMSYDDSRETADALADFLNSDQLDLLTQNLLELAADKAAPTHQLRLAARLSRTSAVENEGHRLMRRFATMTKGWAYSPAAIEVGADGVMTAPDGVKIAVEIKAWRDISDEGRARQTNRLLGRLSMILDRTECKALFVITDEARPSAELVRLYPTILMRPLRIASFADGYEEVLQKFEDLHSIASVSQSERP